MLTVTLARTCVRPTLLARRADIQLARRIRGERS